MTNKITRRRVIASARRSALLAAPMLARHGWAQSTYPNKQIRMVVPFAPAGTTDLLGRIAAQHLTEVWGQTGRRRQQERCRWQCRRRDRRQVGAGWLHAAAGDGRHRRHQPVLSTRTCRTTGRRASRRWRCSARSPNVLAVHPSMPVKTARNTSNTAEAGSRQGELLARRRSAAPAIWRWNISSRWPASRWEHVVYRGSSLVLKDLLAGHIPQHDGQPAALPAAHPVRRAAGVGRELGASVGSPRPMCRRSPSRASLGFDAAPWWYVAAPARHAARYCEEVVRRARSRPSKSPEAVIKKIRDARCCRARAGRPEDLAKHMESRKREVEEGRGRQAGPSDWEATQ